MLNVPIPTLAQSVLRSQRSFDDSFLGLTDSLGRAISAFRSRGFARPLAQFVGRIDQFWHVLAREMASQATPMFATGANLDAWLEFFGVVLPTPQTAVLSIELVSDGSIVQVGGITLPAGTEFAAAGTGIYTLDAPINFPVGAGVTRSGTVTAEDIGSLYNLAPGDSIQLASPPISGIIDPGTVTAIVVSGQDPADEAAKQQLLRDAVTGGRAVGTIAWYQGELRALNTGIGLVFVHPAGRGDGTVALYPLMVPPDGSPSYTIVKPTSGQVAGWTLQLNDTDVQVVNHQVYVDELRTPTIDVVATIAPDNPSTRAAADAAVAARFAEEWPSGTEGMRAYRIAASEIAAAIGAVQSITSSSVTAITAGTDADAVNVPSPGPTADVYALAGQVLVSALSFS